MTRRKEMAKQYVLQNYVPKITKVETKKKKKNSKNFTIATVIALYCNTVTATYICFICPPTN
jgi:hypothetical protein